MNKFGVRLKQLRKAKKLTQKELGEIFGFSDSIITMYEKGAREPSAETLINLAEYFGVSMDYLVGRTDNPKMQIIQTSFLDNEKEHTLEIEYEKENKEDMLTLKELEKLIDIVKKLGIDLNEIILNKNHSTK